MTTIFKLRIKFGQAEFDAEGTEEFVKEQSDMFLRVFSAPATPPPSPNPSQNKSSSGDFTFVGGDSKGSAYGGPSGTRLIGYPEIPIVPGSSSGGAASSRDLAFTVNPFTVLGPVSSPHIGPITASAPAPQKPESGHYSDQLIEEVFEISEGGKLKLKKMPHTKNSDAVLLLLYGYRKLKGQLEVGSTELLDSMAASGAALPRVDRVLAQYHQYLRVHGEKRGTKYSLNDLGVNCCKRLLCEAFVWE